MFKKIAIIIAIILALVIAAVFWSNRIADTDGSDKIQVAASFYPLAHFAEQVGGDLVDVRNITPVGAEPHTYEPSPQDLVAVESAELFIYNGTNLDPWADKLDLPNDVVKLEMTDNIATREQNPHIWLDPINAKREVELIRDALASIDPPHADAYNQNAARYIAELEDLDRSYDALAGNCRLNEAIVSHDAFGYLGARYGIEFHSISGISPEDEPSAKELAGLSDLARERGVEYIFFERLVSDKLAKTLAEEAGIGTLVLDPVAGPANENSDYGYIKVMRDNLANLEIALECQ